MASQYLLPNNDSPETIIVKFGHYRAIRFWHVNTWDILHYCYQILLAICKVFKITDQNFLWLVYIQSQLT